MSSHDSFNEPVEGPFTSTSAIEVEHGSGHDDFFIDEGNRESSSRLGGASPPVSSKEHQADHAIPVEATTSTSDDRISKHVLTILKWVETAHIFSPPPFGGRHFHPRGSRDARSSAGGDTSLLERLHRAVLRRDATPSETTTNTSNSGSGTVSDSFFPTGVEASTPLFRSLRALDEILLTLSEPQTNERDERMNAGKVNLIIETVAKIPSLMKTVLLMEDDKDRQKVCGYKVIKRCMLCGYSLMWRGGFVDEDEEIAMGDIASSLVESIKSTTHDNSSVRNTLEMPDHAYHAPWLVKMLKCNRSEFIQSKAVDYLEMISNFSVDDYALIRPRNDGSIGTSVTRRGSIANAIRAEMTTEYAPEFLDAEDRLFKTVGGLKYLLPAVMSMSESEVERASVTRVMRRVLDRKVMTPFATAIIVFDIIFHIVLLFGWRFLVQENINMAHGIGDWDNPSVARNVLVFMSFWSLGYFLFRQIGDAVSMLCISWKVFYSTFFNTWSLLEVAALTVTFSATLMVRYGATGFSPLSQGFFTFCAFATGLLWLQFLSFLKIINKKLATFVLAIIQIIRDIRLFLLIIFIAVLLFGDMFHTILTVNDDACPGNRKDSPTSGTDIANTNPYCENRGESYLGVYRVIVGDFTIEDYESLTVTIVLFVMCTFMLIIIFLNILIAIVDESYEKATLNAESLFGRARFFTVSKLAALEVLLQPKASRFRKASAFVRASCCILFIFTYIVFADFIIEAQKESRVIAIILVVPATAILTVLFSLLMTGWGEGRATSHPAFTWIQQSNIWNCLLYAPLAFLVRFVLGMSEKPTKSTKNGREWSGRIRHIDSTINTAVTNTNKNTKESMLEIGQRFELYQSETQALIHALEMRIVETESRARAERRTQQMAMHEQLSQMEARFREERQTEMKLLEERIINALSRR